MIRQTLGAMTLAAALMLGAAAGAVASPRAVSYDPARGAQGGQAVYAGTWRGNTYYAAATRWGASLEAQLFAAAANGDLATATRLVERGANVDARDQDGLSPLGWASQYGRTEIARYLLDQHANLNPADRWGYTPLMWAAQEGHTGTIDLLLARGANPRVVSRNGVTAHTLARYSGSWRAAATLERWLEGRGAAPSASAPKPVAAKPLAPSRVTIVPPKPVAAAPAPKPVAAAPAPAPAEPGMLAKAQAFKQLGETGAAFTADFSDYVKASTAGGFGLNALAAATSPDMETGKLLTAFFAKVGQSQDLKAARPELDKAKASLGGNAQARFARFVAAADKSLVDIGY